jgi:REP element-mobilizing transposase RayT
MDKFQNKYRIESARLKNWDYGWNAPYFVTICTANRVCYFGDVQNDEMRFSETGKMAHKCWLEIPEHFPFVTLDVHVVMPNHVHGIIIINKPNDGRNPAGNAPGNAMGNVETQNFASLTNQTQNFASLPPPPPPPPSMPPSSPPPPSPKNKFGPQSQNLASIIRGYKTGVTIFARNNNIVFAWQPRYHDHVIRNPTSYLRIRNYIINNPKKWDTDNFYGHKYQA